MPELCSSLEQLRAEPGRVDLWYTWSDRIRDPRLVARYTELLAPNELQQWRRYRVEGVRHQYLVTRALVRSVLSCYGPHPPEAWTFGRNAYGKPFVGDPPLPGVAFNLSHTRGLVICGVTGAERIGVDVERLDRTVEFLQLAQRFFAPGEAAAVAATRPPERPWRFFQFWTLKEAYIKARGMGLSIPLDGFAFELSEHGPPRIGFARPGSDDPSRWQFMQLSLGDLYQMAVAVDLPAPQAPRLCLRQVVPLAWQAQPVLLAPNRANRWAIEPS
ncbi:MAG TPA: 4'-phosphopantetheinyl transferase superfamily protein [Planctomycetaceae bacterium]|nr:4'-phosphopantetheinyl transferase superfamily protein [Planctomycetaceae bacterium]